MSDITLRFVPPSDPDIGALIVFEAPTQSGPFTQIDRTTEIGVYPNWIDVYVCRTAVDRADWFAIAWEDGSGAIGDMSEAVQGGTFTAVGEIVRRVALRAPDMDERIVADEATTALEEVFGTSEPDPTVITARQYSGLTLLTMARVQMIDLLMNSSQTSFTAGIVSISTKSTGDEARIDKLIKEANKLLNLNFSRIMLLKEISVAGGYKRLAGVDLSRAIYELQ